MKPGDTVKVEQSLITVESDKASMEIPSSAAGVIKDLKVKVGDKVNVGDLVALLQGSGAASPAPQASAEKAAPAPASAGAAPADRTPPTAALPPHEPTSAAGTLPHASPSVRKFARELGVPLEEVKGTGPKGRITQEDVQGFTKAGRPSSAHQGGVCQGAGRRRRGTGPAALAKVDFAKFGAVERKALPRIKKISAANLHRNWVMIPHVTNHDDADITELEAFPRAAEQGKREGRHQGGACSAS